ncbi:MBL fold metallo-hydrolase [Leptolyngbya sp. 7M]|uniref:MBL fold metallo-hydrolase n=1 Tax=Leptolyngbya sp. 7M TaxID=2812896 RepID=UPI001B8B7AA2|nr:MBL fold metallo-hydrolase [Leptolyngbya sp. 7M]QYO65432.1 MBL fold metallo-hydrolase [Leptolyngbya sp. 7M]
MEIGDYRVEIVPDTEFRLDGGAMFGVVPRVLWERVCPPDELNRIRQQMNCVFIDTGKEKVLIETGIGEKWTEKEMRMYGIFRERPFAETLFEKTGCTPNDITIVINTHLHFDHAGGNTVHSDRLPVAGGKPEPIASAGDRFGSRSAVPQFKNARYLVSAREIEHAESPHERDRASYLPENWRPMVETGQLEAMPEEYEPIPGLKLQTIRGHSETMQTWRLDRGGKTMYGFADLIPTSHHVPLPWIMGYDLYPTETLAFKREILPKAVEGGWMCLFYHDFDRPLCRLKEVDGKIRALELFE